MVDFYISWGTLRSEGCVRGERVSLVVLKGHHSLLVHIGIPLISSRIFVFSI